MLLLLIRHCSSFTVAGKSHCSSFTGAGKNLSLTVSSLRVDTVASKGLGISRRRVWESWLDGGLSLNGQPVKKHSHQVRVGDSVEVTGKQTNARVVVMEIGGRTKKGGYHIDIIRYKHFSSSSSSTTQH